jgi:hypothetical protein
VRQAEVLYDQAIRVASLRVASDKASSQRLLFPHNSYQEELKLNINQLKTPTKSKPVVLTY